MDKNLVPKKKINVKKILEFVGVTTIIMSVIGLGIYFFIKAIITPPDPCGDQGKLTCKSNNACINTNICDYSTAEYTLQYDPDSCSCKIICNDPNAKGINNDGSGSSTITMKKQDDGSYIPNGDIICGIDCPEATSQDFSDDSGGPGYCKSDHLCGTLTYENGGGHGIYENKHCFSKNSFLQCPSGIESICPINEGCTDNGYCKETPCSGTEEINGSVYEYVYACQSDDECGVSDAKCKTDDGKFKHFNNMGYCVNKDGGIANSNNRKKNEKQCGHKQFFGQDKNNNFVNCQKFGKKTTGVYANNQCEESGIFLQDAPHNTCAIYGICSNNWQALDPNGNVSCSASPVPDTSSYNCCDDNCKAKSFTGDKFCCPKKTHDNGKCLNTTKYRYSKAALNSIGEPNPTISAAEGIPCSTNSDCEDSRQKLWNLLGNKGKYPDSWSKSQGEPNSINKYVNMYCESQGEAVGYCKAECGLFDGTSQINNNYNVANINFNGVNNPYSFCYYKDNEECELNPTSFHNQTDAGTPICKKKNFPDAWSRPYGDGYSTLYAGSFPPKKCNNNNKKQNACLETMNSFNNVHTISMNNTSCMANLACDQLDVTTWIGTGESETESLKWTDLNKNSTIQEIKNPDFRVNQTSNSTPDKVTGLIYRYNPKNCQGNIPTGYDKDSTKSPFDGASSLGECSPNLANHDKLKMTSDGYWNQSGTQLLYENHITSNFQNVNFGNDNENFGNINENFGNINENFGNINSNSNYDPTKFIGDIVISKPSTAYIRGNTSKDKNKYWCSAFQLIGDNNFYDFQKLTNSRNSNPYLRCEDTNDGGVITCLDSQRNATECCEDSSQGISDTVKIKVNKSKTSMNQNKLWSCDGFPAKGKKLFYCDKYYECKNVNNCSDIPGTGIKPDCRSTPDISNCGSKCYDTGLKLWQNNLKQLPNPVKDDGTEFKFTEYFYSNLNGKSISLYLTGPEPVCEIDSIRNIPSDLNNIIILSNFTLGVFKISMNWDENISSGSKLKFNSTSNQNYLCNTNNLTLNKYKTLCFSSNQDKPQDVYWFNDNNDSNGNNYSKFKINIIDFNGNKGFTLTIGTESLAWATNGDAICQKINTVYAIKNPSKRPDKFCNIFGFQYDKNSDLTYIIGLNPENIDTDYIKFTKSSTKLFYDFKNSNSKLILSFRPYRWFSNPLAGEFSKADFYTCGVYMNNYNTLFNKKISNKTTGGLTKYGYSNIDWEFNQPMSESTCCAIQIYDN